jgi:sulfoxide reductase heme-binding subunit YedZ
MLEKIWKQISAILNAIAGWRFFKPAVFAACTVPALLLAFDLYMGTLADLQTLLKVTGENALALLLLSLSITPIRRVFKVSKINSVRRMVGVWAFFYALGHASVYLLFDRACIAWSSCQPAIIWEDITTRPFIMVGMLAFIILVPLALTSTTGWMRRLGKKWQTLHRLVYVAGVAGVVHFIWGQKSDLEEPIKWAVWLAVILGIRVYYAMQKRAAGARVRPA